MHTYSLATVHTHVCMYLASHVYCFLHSLPPPHPSLPPFAHSPSSPHLPFPTPHSHCGRRSITLMTTSHRLLSECWASSGEATGRCCKHRRRQAEVWFLFLQWSACAHLPVCVSVYPPSAFSFLRRSILPLQLTYREHLLPGPSVCLCFSPHDPTCIDLPLDKVE